MGPQKYVFRAAVGAPFLAEVMQKPPYFSAAVGDALRQPGAQPQPQQHSAHRVLHHAMRVFLGVSAPFRPLDEALYGEGAQEPQRPVHQRWSWHPAEAQGQVLKLAQPDTVKKWQPNWFYRADIRTYAEIPMQPPVTLYSLVNPPANISNPN